MDEIIKWKHNSTLHRWRTAIKDTALTFAGFTTSPWTWIGCRGRCCRNAAGRRSSSSPNGPSLGGEHQAIVAREQNPERRAFYQLAWNIGASQSDVAFLEAGNINWENKVISFARKKTGTIALMRFDEETADILRSLPADAPLFLYLRTVRAGDRATEFKQRCSGLKITGVSLHSYRYAWAERAKQVGYPERFAQEALGHNSKAVHRAYARKAKVELPSLDEYEHQRHELGEDRKISNTTISQALSVKSPGIPATAAAQERTLFVLQR